VVTGASSGIGQALAAGLASRGYPLVLVARRAERLEQVARGLRVRHDVEVEVRRCDLRDDRQRAILRDELVQRRVAVLCDNAGFTTCGPLSESDHVREREAVTVNVAAAHELALAVLPGMLARRDGSILITGSAAGVQPVPSAATYAATKAFVNSFSQALSAELRGTGVTCTLLAPGPVRTEFFAVGGVGRMEALTRWFFWQTPDRVAEDALVAMEQGRRVISPGLAAKLQAFCGHHLPRRPLFALLRWIFLPILRRSARPLGRSRRRTTAAGAGPFMAVATAAPVAAARTDKQTR
jgi:short-subunit dehydrogenase